MAIEGDISTRIFYFTGTGNALKSASWIQASMQQNGIQTDLTNIATIRGKKPDLENNHLIGICSPTHGFNFPPVVLNFLFKLPRAKKQSAFIVNTRAGMKLGKFFLPGLSGVAQLFTALILLLKGYKIVGMRPIDMPSNWISLHPGIKEQVSVSIMKRCKTISTKFGEKIASGKKDFKALQDIIQDLLIAPVSLGYYFIGRFVFAKSFYADHYCTLCYKCVRECPVKAIRKIDNRPYWTHNCESCMHCMNTCPVNSIQTAHGFIVGVFIISISVILKIGWNILLDNTDSSIINSIYEIGILKFTIESIIAIFILIVAYRIMHYLLKFKFFERFIAYTSFTSYRFWRRFKNIRIQSV